MLGRYRQRCVVDYLNFRELAWPLMGLNASTELWSRMW